MSLDVSKLQVHSTTLCPKTIVESTERAKAINCSDIKKYICLPNEENTELFEVCFTFSTVLVKKGKNNLELYHYRRYLVEMLPIRCKTLYNQSIKHLSNLFFIWKKKYKRSRYPYTDTVCVTNTSEIIHTSVLFQCC